MALVDGVLLEVGDLVRWVGELPGHGPFDLTMLARHTYSGGKLAGLTLYWAEPDAADQLLG